jgi:outer membrane protein OmpA-like peptidoglycan-associated protein
LFRTISIISLALVGCSRPVTFQEDTAIWVIAPSQPSPGAAVGADAIVVWGNVEFDDNATISPASFAVLNEVASLGRQNPRVKQIVVEKVRLSQPQAAAVLAYLVERGVANDVAISCAPDQGRAMTPASPPAPTTTDHHDEVSTHAN